MTELDKKHNVLTWEIAVSTQYRYYKAKHNEYTFEITHCCITDRGLLEIYTYHSLDPIKSSKPTTIDNAKAQAELFILNLKR